MLEYAATIKLLTLVGYACLFFVLTRSTVPFSVKLHFALYLLGLGLWQFASFMVTLTKSQDAALALYNLQVGSLIFAVRHLLPLHQGISRSQAMAGAGHRRLRGTGRNTGV